MDRPHREGDDWLISWHWAAEHWPALSGFPKHAIRLNIARAFYRLPDKHLTEEQRAVLVEAEKG